MRLTVAIDIDGVVSPLVDTEALNAADLTLLGWPEYLQFKVMFHAIVAVPVRDLLVEFDQHPAISPMWHSSWRESATEDLAPVLGVGASWPQFGTEDEYRKSIIWWKLAAVQRWLDQHAENPEEHLLWLDDDIADALRSGEISPVLAAHPQLTMISPALQHGLTPQHLDTIHDLMRRLT